MNKYKERPLTTIQSTEWPSTDASSQNTDIRTYTDNDVYKSRSFLTGPELVHELHIFDPSLPFDNAQVTFQYGALSNLDSAKLKNIAFAWEQRDGGFVELTYSRD